MNLDVANIDRDALAEIQRRISERLFYTIDPYDWQQDVIDGGRHYLQRMLMAANRVGKTFVAAYETTAHVTQDYPDTWDGFRIPKNETPLIWVSSLTNETSRDIVQRELLGPTGAEGTGMIPKERIHDLNYRQAGIPDVVDTIIVRTNDDKLATIKTKVAEQGWKKYQGTQPHFIWQDEEPDHFKVVTECFMRLMTSKGRYLVTFTPLMGETELVSHFKQAKPEDKRRLYTATWDDAGHISASDKADYLSSFPEHERESRSKGVPMMGEGAVFPIADSQITCDPFKVPDHFFQICGVDYGVDHPAAGVWLAYDVDRDTVYLTDEYSKDRELPPYHASAIKRRDPLDFIPVVGPHDGMNEEKSSGEKIALQYAAEGVRMLPLTARYQDDKGGRQAVEPIVQDMLMRMRDGRFKVFTTCTKFLSEKRGLHRKDNKIVALQDDVFKACTYALMMLRYAVPLNYANGSASSRRNNKPMF